LPQSYCKLRLSSVPVVFAFFKPLFCVYRISRFSMRAGNY
jgi:hypothetical protein